MTHPNCTNEDVAKTLEATAEHLARQQASSYRIQAYRAGAQVVRSYPGSIQELALVEGRAGLDALPKIGPGLSAAIDEIVHTGRSRALDRMKGRMTPVELFQSVPAIGEELALRIHKELQIDTLEALEVAAHDGRLDALVGFGPRRLQGICNSLATMLAKSSRQQARRFEELRDAGAEVHASAGAVQARPLIRTVLAIDRQYRELAKSGALPRIAPVRNNPEGKAWLPVLHSELDSWHFTVMYSNTDRAHDLGRTRDWVVAYYEKEGRENQCTIVTETRGKLAGRRVVRGRESSCAEHYKNNGESAVPSLSSKS